MNALAAADRIAPLDTSALRARRASYTNSEPHDLRGILLSSALALFLIDAIIVALLGAGLAALLRRRAVPAAIAFAFLLSAMLATPSPSRADDKDDFAIKAVSQTRLAYVVTGNADVDSIVKAGMAGLTLFLAQRTALEAGDPIGIDPARDELAFFPLIYWPIVPGASKPPQDAINRIDAYMKQGGTVLFDTRDAIEAPPGEGGASQTPGMQALRNILSSLDVPELEPVPRDHVLTKTFYLLRDFPGRFDSGQTWVEALPREEEDEATARPARGGDGVSPIIITSNDLAGAWAIRPDGQPMLPLTQGEPRQREFAFRAGVNIVMYTLTGNYKADQVHAPALIERLGNERLDRHTLMPGKTFRKSLGHGPSPCIPGQPGTTIQDRAMKYGIAFTPLVPSLVLWLALAVIVAIAGLLLLTRARGAAIRVTALALVLLALANPSFTREEREPLSSVVAVVIDKSPSQNFGERTRETAQAQTALVDSLKKIKGLEVRVVEAGQADGETDGTKLFGALSSVLSDVPVDRVAGAFMITDGRVHDIPANAAALGFQAPVHALITGRKDERDRRIAISAAPGSASSGRRRPSPTGWTTRASAASAQRSWCAATAK